MIRRIHWEEDSSQARQLAAALLAAADKAEEDK